MFGFMAILFAIDWIFNLGYQSAFAGGQTNSFVGLLGIVVGVAMYAIISLMLVYGSYRLVQTVPDAILQWIGGRDDDSIGVEQHSDKALGAYVAMRGGAGAIGRGMREGMQATKASNNDKSPNGDDTAANQQLSAGSTPPPSTRG